MERTDSSENPPMGGNDGNNIDNVNELSLLYDYMEVPDFGEFIDIIRGESGVYNDNHFSTATADDYYYQYGGGGPNQPFEAAAATTIATTLVYDPNLLLDSLEDMEEEHQDGDKDREEYSSGATVNIAGDDSNGTSTIQRKRKSSGTTTTTTTTKGDRSKTLVSERRRRGRMKEKLYELRALVPNITKMDKASIIGDAALYVQELQMRAKKLKAEISSLEESEVDKPQQESLSRPTKKTRAVNSYSVSKTITKMEVVQVGERGFYVQLVCNKGLGVAVSLYKALESFSSLSVESSNLVTVDETFELKFTLNVGKLEVNSANLKLWVAGAFLNHGFEFKTSPSP